MDMENKRKADLQDAPTFKDWAVETQCFHLRDD